MVPDLGKIVCKMTLKNPSISESRKELEELHEEAPTGQRWQNLSINKDYVRNGLNFRCHLKKLTGYHYRMLFWLLINKRIESHSYSTFLDMNLPKGNQTMFDMKSTSLQKYSSSKREGKITLPPCCNP